MTRSTVFKSNQSQAIRLPKAVALPDTVKKVEIVKLGRGRLVMPAEAVWDDFFDGPVADEDFMEDRAQPDMQSRELL